jgi:hypothetical protein
MDWLRINDISNPERYFLDPRSPDSQKAFAMRAQSKAKAAESQQALMQQAVGLEQLRVALDKYKSDAQLQFQYYDAVLSAQVEEAKITASAVIDWIKTKTTALTAFIGAKRGDTSDKGTDSDGGSKSGAKPAVGSDTD